MSMNNINHILKKFCDIFALELCRVEQSNFVDYHLYITTLPKENSPFYDNNFPTSNLNFVGDYMENTLYLQLEEDFPKSDLIEIDEFIVKLTANFNKEGWEYKNGEWV